MASLSISIDSLSKKTFHTLSRSPRHFLLLQLPAASAIFVQELLEIGLGDKTILILLISLPYLFVASVVSTAATFHSVLNAENSSPLVAGESFQAVKSKWKLLVPASLIVGVVSVLGVIALILPGIYFAALYLFVPHLIMSDGNEKVTTYLHRSTRLTQQRLFRTLVIVFVVFLVMTWTYLIGEWSGAIAGDFFHSTFLSGLVQIAVEAAFTVTVSVFIDVWICHYFLTLRAQVTNGKSQETT